MSCELFDDLIECSEPDKRFATITCPALTPSQPVEDTMLEAILILFLIVQTVTLDLSPAFGGEQ